MRFFVKNQNFGQNRIFSKKNKILICIKIWFLTICFFRKLRVLSKILRKITFYHVKFPRHKSNDYKPNLLVSCSTVRVVSFNNSIFNFAVDEIMIATLWFDATNCLIDNWWSKWLGARPRAVAFSQLNYGGRGQLKIDVKKGKIIGVKKLV